MIIETFSRDFPPLNVFTATFKTELAEHSPTPIEFYEASLGTVSMGDPVAETALAGYLRAVYATRPPDLVIPVGGPAADFWWRHRDALFPEAPVVLGPMENRVLDRLPLGTNDTAVTFRFDAPGAVANILQTLPATTNIAVVLGDSPLERFWANECRKAWEPFTDRVQFLWLNKLPLSEMCRRAAALPPRTAILYTILFVDAAGVPHEQTQALDRLCKAANAPAFGIFAQNLGHGILGGQFICGEKLGREAAHMGARILAGETAGAIPPRILEASPPTFDWRQLQRWNLSERGLPSGSVIRFRPPSPWVRYRWYIVGALAIIVAQAATIIGLWMQRVARARAEALAYQVSGRLMTAQEEERRRIARDLHDDLNQRLALLAVELDMAGRAEVGERMAPRLENMARQVKDLSSSLHQLSCQLHPAKLDQLGLTAAARALCSELSAQAGLPIVFTHEQVPRELPGDTAIGLFRVLQEALGNAIRHSDATEVHADIRMVGQRLCLTVSDDGVGFDVSRTQHGSGLGLVSMEERARLLHGRLAVRTAPGQGTRVELTVPAGEPATKTGRHA